MLARPSALVLVVANLLPLAGVLWLDWSVLEVLLLYWTESVIIGGVNVLRMALSSAPNRSGARRRLAETEPAAAASSASTNSLSTTIAKLLLIPFFIAHFGMFCFGHLSAVVFLLGAPRTNGNLLSALPPAGEPMFWLAVAAILLSHLFSFFVNFLGAGEYRQTSVSELMQRPYGRILVMHVTVIAGAFLIEQLDNPLALLLVLIGVKTAVDLKLHTRERDLLGAEEDIVLQQQSSPSSRA